VGKPVVIAYEKPQRRRKTVEAVAVTKVEAVRAEVVRCEHGFPEGTACSGCFQKRIGMAPSPGAIGPFWLTFGPAPHGPISEARDSAGGFTEVRRDPAKFEAAKKRAAVIGPLDNDRQLHRFLREDLESQDQEIFVVVGLDLNNDLRLYSEIARGQRDRVAVSPVDVLRPVIIEGCVGYVCAHNHPSGHAEPSDQDRTLTEQLRRATEPYGGSLVFLDHLIVGSGGEYYSFSDRKLKKG
jgi:hypothetical protein